jgi:uncharacterized protein YcaQ
MARALPLLAAGDAARLLLGAQGLLEDPARRVTAASLQALVTRLGFVQMDTIQVLARAHDLTLFSRLDGYRPEHLRCLLEEKKTLFEGFTHDASAIPTAWFPHWKPRFLRDRARALRRFGFDYRFEAFVPEPKRQYGYYVLPILEGERRVGRLDAKVHRDRGLLEVKGLWWESGIKATRARMRGLSDALARLAAFAGTAEVQLPRSR